jgi:hypothetical protein
MFFRQDRNGDNGKLHRVNGRQEAFGGQESVRKARPRLAMSRAAPSWTRLCAIHRRNVGGWLSSLQSQPPIREIDTAETTSQRYVFKRA